MSKVIKVIPNYLFAFFASILAWGGLSIGAFAQDGEPGFGGGGAAFYQDITEDWVVKQSAEERLTTFGTDLLGDSVDPDTGALVFDHLDVAIPGNSGLEVAVRRRIAQGRIYHETEAVGFGDWIIQVPQISETYPGIQNGIGAEPGPIEGPFNNHCSTDRWFPPVAEMSPNNFVRYRDYSNGLTMEIPGQGTKPIARIIEAEHFPAEAKMGTKDNWYITCTTSDYPDPFGFGGIEGMIAHAPNGTTYKFDKVVERRAHNAISHESPLLRFYYVWLASEVTDIHGNWVKYNYDSEHRLTSITSNDGRQIDFTYDGLLIKTVTANGRTWTYDYSAWGLAKVTQPDGQFWSMDMDGMRVNPTPGAECDNPALASGEIELTHPYGITGTFKVNETRHWKIKGYDPDGMYNFTGRCMEETHRYSDEMGTLAGQYVTRYIHRPYMEIMSVTEKKLVGPSFPASTWTWQYEGYNGQSPTTPGSDLKWTLMTAPGGTQTKYFHNRVEGENEGLLMKTETSKGGTLLSQTDKTYVIEDMIGENHMMGAQHKALAPRHEVSSTRQQDGDTFYSTKTYNTNQAASNYSFGLPVSQSASSNISTTPRTTVTEYEHKFANWVLGLTKKVTMNGREEMSATYNALGQKTAETRYQAPYATFGYHPDGNIAWVKNANDEEIKADDWHRGKPQTITRPDNTTVLQSLDDNGWVMDATDALSYVSEYRRDSMGRILRFIPPKDTQQWDDTQVWYDFSGNRPKQHIRRGDAKTVIQYDNLFRPLLVVREDLTTGWKSFNRTAYNLAGQVKFESFPSGASNDPAGTNFFYDGLGRLTQEKETVAPFASVKTAYLAGHKTRVTDAEGYATNTFKNGFGEILRIVQPENTTTVIYRNQWGQKTRVQQFGTHDGVYANKSQHYYYDSQQRLCRHHTPSGGSSLYEYDAAGYLLSSSRGHWGLGSTSCTTPSGVTLANFSYDTMGRLLMTDYADDGTPDTVRTYDANGNLKTLVRQDGSGQLAWDQDPEFNSWSYDYNELGLLTNERLFVDWQNFNLNYQYNDDTSMFSSTRDFRNEFWGAGESYSHSFVFDRDGLGRGTAVSLDGTSLANNAIFHPSGELTNLTFGNGQVQTQLLDARLQPLSMVSQGNGVTALDLSFQYNARGLITHQTDGVDANNSRIYGYDGQGRLTSAEGPWFGGRQGTFKYDALGNILEKTLGNRTVTMTYNNANRLTRAVDTGETGTRDLGYDHRGNVTSLGNLAMFYDATDRPTELSGEVNGTYSYDGHGRRVKSVTETEHGDVVRYNVYNASGALIYVREDNPTASGKEDAITNYVKLDELTVSRVKTTGSVTNFTNDVTWLHHDHLGSAVAGTDASGAILWTEAYTPYGIALVNDAANDNQAGFTGHIKDSDTGLNYMQARYYDPVIGRFLSHDPQAFSPDAADMFNRYVYVANNPVNNVDPDGELLMKAFRFGKKVWKHKGNVVKAAKEEFGEIIEAVQVVLDPNASALEKAAAVGGVVTGIDVNVKKTPKPKIDGKNKPSAGGGCCFVAGTLVETETGLRAIEEIELGDYVLARNPETGETSLKEVTDLIRRHERVIWEVSLTGQNGASEFFETTDDHPWWVIDAKGGGAWIDTEDLSAGMIVTTVDNSTMTIASVIETDRVDATYNLTVADFETYFVGENKVLVHNCPIGDGDVDKISSDRISAPPSKRGNAPIGDDGNPIELHHTDGPEGQLKEMTQTDHRRGDNFKENHPPGYKKLSTDERKQFNKDKKDYWKKEWDKGRFEGDDD